MKLSVRSNLPTGFTLIEILIATALLTTMLALAFVGATNFSKRLFLAPADSFLVHMLTSASRHARDGFQQSDWGVYLPYDETTRELSEIIVFSGLSYLTRDASRDQHVSFSPRVQFVTVDLSGPAPATTNDHEVVFTRITGETSQYGTITFSIFGVTRSVVVSPQGFVTREL